MKLIKFTCPECGAHLEVDLDNRILFCPFCGNKLLIDDETVDVNIHYYDEAKVIEANIEKDKYERKLQQEAEDDEYYTEKYVEWKNNKKLRHNKLIISLLITVTIFVLFVITRGISSLHTVLGILCCCMVAYSLILFFVSDYRNLKDDPRESYRENLKNRNNKSE